MEFCSSNSNRNGNRLLLQLHIDVTARACHEMLRGAIKACSKLLDIQISKLPNVYKGLQYAGSARSLTGASSSAISWPIHNLELDLVRSPLHLIAGKHGKSLVSSVISGIQWLCHVLQVGRTELPSDIFGVEVRKDILHRVVRWQRAKKQQVQATLP